ncbi:hypothetical protein [Dongia sedimenti]|uniref:Uncharacterized protein n=1 Tax=Dongia sedimenti TaxID=3064282 RepID=A0ABU0YRX6_9PROT|nr:hypothetical protein [Rhodospirillaceae bacterium R-7]
MDAVDAFASRSQLHWPIRERWPVKSGDEIHRSTLTGRLQNEKAVCPSAVMNGFIVKGLAITFTQPLQNEKTVSAVSIR